MDVFDRAFFIRKMLSWNTYGISISHSNSGLSKMCAVVLREKFKINYYYNSLFIINIAIINILTNEDIYCIKSKSKCLCIESSYIDTCKEPHI